jgi:hypothetical protein
MSPPLEISLEELRAADARRVALTYVSEAFAEAVLDGIDVDAFAEAALCAVFRELVANYGEERSAELATALPERIRGGEFSARRRQ